jgi:hypothetical protein
MHIDDRPAVSVGLLRHPHPATVPLAGDLDVRDFDEGALVDAVVTVPDDRPVEPDDRPVDLVGRHHQQRTNRPSEDLFHLGGVQQPKSDIERLAETVSAVVVDLTGVHDRPQPANATSTQVSRSLSLAELFSQRVPDEVGLTTPTVLAAPSTQGRRRAVPNRSGLGRF